MLFRMEERWLPIPGWASYEVSDHGRVRSIPRTVKKSDGTTQTFGYRILKDARHSKKSAHRCLPLTDNGQRKTRLVHHLVLEAFVGPRPKGLIGCHNDGDAANNHVSNLRWDTHASNVRDSLKHGTGHQYMKKTHCRVGHEYTPDNLYIAKVRLSRGGIIQTYDSQMCRMCRSIRDPRYKAPERFRSE